MFQKTLKYIILLLFLFQLLVEIDCQPPFKPKQRRVHTATHINDKLFILDGIFNGEILNDFFYLDVSSSFNTKELLWKDLSEINIVPTHFGAASVKGGANNNTLFLYGGSNSSTTALVHTFDPQSNSWSTPTISGVNPIRKFSLTGIVDYNCKMYLWGGGDAKNNNGTNSMIILDTINLIWGEGTLVGAPIPRITYGAVLLPDQTIIYIGNYFIIIYTSIIFSSFLLKSSYCLGGYNPENKIELTLNLVIYHETVVKPVIKFIKITNIDTLRPKFIGSYIRYNQ
jgi:hypothetical protein